MGNMTTLIDFFTTPLQYEFMMRGMIAAVLVGIVCAVVGTFVVLRGMAFFGDALAQLLREMVEAGKIKPVVEKVYPLVQAVDAMKHLATGHARGKIVLKIR